MRWKHVATVVGGIVLAAALGVPHTTAQASTSMEAMVKNAKTPADNLALAAHYDELAATAQKEAASHRSMGGLYKASSLPKGGNTTSFVQHCNNLAKTFEAQATDFKAMAEAHRQLAETAGRNTK